MAFAVNGVTGFYFDKFKIKPLKCWSPWMPKENILINNPNSSIYSEEFIGTLENSYNVINIDESQVKDGPAIWSIKEGDAFEESYILQETNAYDGSIQKRPNFITLKNKYLHQGTYTVEFKAKEPKGIISIIFRYFKEDTVEKYYIFELNNERNEPSLDLKFVNGGEISSIMSKNASQIKGLNKNAYIPNKSNLIKIDVINNVITVGVSQNGNELIEVFTTLNDKISGGLVGFGTYKSSAKFTKVTLSPPKIKMTTEDVNKILTTSPSRLFSTIPFPSAKKIEDISFTSSGKILGNTATESLKVEVARFASSLGYNFRKDKQKSVSSNSNNNLDSPPANDNDKTNESSTENKSIDNDKSNLSQDWKTCITTRSVKDRSTWCSAKYPAELIKSKCEVNWINIFNIIIN